jgi:hypothetical protein
LALGFKNINYKITYCFNWASISDKKYLNVFPGWQCLWQLRSHPGPDPFTAAPATADFDEGRKAETVLEKFCNFFVCYAGCGHRCRSQHLHHPWKIDHCKDNVRKEKMLHNSERLILEKSCMLFLS